ncbi:MAG: DNA polymerase III subunit epsilon [Actinomycetales bacterium]|nr:MAG: DNA polymerase III subunit epsilon [Actinomycetales bacterium]
MSPSTPEISRSSFDSPTDNWQPGFSEIGRPLKDVTFIVLDLETTGASPALGCAITEIGAVAVRGGEMLAEFSTFVNPDVPLPEYITNLTGITDEMLRDAPQIADAYANFMHFISEHSEHDAPYFVAHNAPFDIGFLKAAARSLSEPWPKHEVLDTVRFARLVIERSEILNYKLGTLAEFFQTQSLPTHRALDDVKTTVEVLHRLIERAAGFEVFTIQDLQQFMKRLPERKIKP